MMKKVSIIVPVYNTGKYVSKCIDSILNQDYPNIEVIIIEDYSLDDSREVIKKYNKNPQVKIILQPINKGVGVARNIGLDNASGDYIAFIDSDDIIEPSMISHLVLALEHYNVSIAMCNHRSFIKEPKLLYPSTSHPKLINLDHNIPFLIGMRGYCWDKLYRRELFNKLRFPEGIKFEDLSFTYPALILSRQIAYVDEELYNYRRNLNGITMLNKRIPNRGIIDLYYASEKLKDNYQLIRQDNTFDQAVIYLAHAAIYIAALDSLCWLSMSYLDHQKMSNYITYLANRKYGITHLENPVILNNMKRLSYVTRIKLLETLIDPNYHTSASDDKILKKITKIVDNYDEKGCKVKKK